MAFHEDDWREKSGQVVGSLLAPVTAGVSALRQARMFHPDGVVYTAEVTAASSAPDLAPLAERLVGTALMRFSSALWRSDHELPDVLGAAIRFRVGTAREQDLLLATIRFPWTMPFAPFATNFRSFLWNHYHAVSPFEVSELGRVKFRLRSPRLGPDGGTSREEHLRRVAAEGRASFELQARRLQGSPFSRSWETLAHVSLRSPLIVDQAALRFSPFRDGAGLHPVGFVHALRVATYAGSQEARPIQSNAAANS
jgi:hypothetical protein